MGEEWKGVGGEERLKEASLEVRKVTQKSSSRSCAGASSASLRHGNLPGASNPLNYTTGPGKRAHYVEELWVSAPAVDVVPEAARCLGAGETPLGLPRRRHHVGAGCALGGPGCPLRRVLAVSRQDSPVAGSL